MVRMRCWIGDGELSGRVGSSRRMERYMERRRDGEAAMVCTRLIRSGSGKYRDTDGKDWCQDWMCGESSAASNGWNLPKLYLLNTTHLCSHVQFYVFVDGL